MSPFVYVIAEAMPCRPHELHVPSYALPSLLGRAEPEEAAARILTLVRERGYWTGITWRELAQQMKAEYEASQKNEALKNVYWAALDAYRL